MFEFSMMWIIVAYKEIGIGFIRNCFYTFRPVIMFMVRNRYRTEGIPTPSGPVFISGIVPPQV